MLLRLWMRFFVGFLLGFALATQSSAQPYGLDAPQAVGPFLDGVMPDKTPQDPGSSTWQVVDAFQVAVPNTLVIEPNPADNRLYVGSRGGVIVSFENDELATDPPEDFMDISDRVAVVWDGGFLGLAFHPLFGGVISAPEDPIEYETTFYVYYSSYCPTTLVGSSYVNDWANCNPGYPQGSRSGFFNTWLRLSRFEAYWDDVAQVWRGDPSSEEPMFNVRLYNGSHRGGGPEWGADGKLYLMVGDQFRYDTAQDIVDSFEGGSLRLEADIIDNGDGTWDCPVGSHFAIRTMQDVTGNADEMTGHRYCIPDDNPWPGWSGENFGEYNSIGHRNPHRMTLDPVSGLLWSGEVGQSAREEINIITTGRNYQWPYMEGYATGVRAKPAFIIGQEQPPVADFDRTEARTIIGGYVYRGTRFPELSGLYITGDYSTNNIWALTLDMNTMTATKQLLTTFPPGSLGTFGQDNAGEIYLGDVVANIPLQRLERSGGAVPDPPALLSQTGAFLDTANFIVNPAAVPYDLVPFWSDGAYKQRWIFLPNDGTHDAPDEQISFSSDSNWGFPDGTVAMKHFELGLNENDPSNRVRLETRMIVQGVDGKVYGVTYRWRPDQLDADLLSVAETADYSIQLAGGGTRTQTWLFPSRAECLQCHTDGAGGFLGLRTHQQNREMTYPSTGRTDNQLRTWNSLGMFRPALNETDIPSYPQSARLDDVTASLETRVRSWLDSNCSNCHRPETGNRAAFDARFTTPLSSQGLVWGGALDDLGISEPYLVSPADPSASVVRVRAAAAGGSGIKMPPLAKELAEQPAVDLLDEWITRLDPGYPRTGLNYAYYEEVELSVLPNFDALTPVANGATPTIDISVRLRDDDFAFRFTGYIEIPEAGDWTFYTSSDDGSQLFIDGTLVVDNDGLHANEERSGTINLAAGFYEIVVTMFERAGEQVLTASWSHENVPKQFIPGGRLYLQLPGPIDNEPPVLSSPGPQSNVEGESLLLALSATDPDGDLPYYEAAPLPAGLSINKQTGEISGTIEFGQVGVFSVDASVSDGPEISVVHFDWTITAAGLCQGVDCPDADPEDCIVGECDSQDGLCYDVPVADGAACDVGGLAGLCSAGNCETSDPCESSQCDDGNECTLDSCDSGTGLCSMSALPDDTPCSLGSCQSGVCQSETAACDGMPARTPCGVGGICDYRGNCIPGNLCDGVDCNDGNECTWDGCDPVGGVCASSPVTDGTACSGGAGTCTGGLCDAAPPLCEGVDCNDGNECTEDRCNPQNGSCLNPSAGLNGTPCGGGSGRCNAGSCEPNPTDCTGRAARTPCGVGGICDYRGNCIPGNLCDGVDCNDGNECTWDGCDPVGGVCASSPVTDGTACSGGAGTCTGGLCDAAPPLCEGVDCNDGNECTEDRCNPQNGSCLNPSAGLNGTPCGGGSGRCNAGSCEPNPSDCTGRAARTPCGVGGICDYRGNCIPGNLCDGVDCNDGNECTWDGCDPVGGVCASSPVTDGTACSGGAGTCTGGLCDAAAPLCEGVDCNDGNECTEDRCNPQNGSCLNPSAGLNGTPCGGGSGRCNAGSCEPNPTDCTGRAARTPCGVGGICDYRGNCIPGNLCDGVDCNDGNECTWDGCDPVGGVCANSPATGIVCNGGAGTCDAAGNCLP